jgi:hypothetical protein
MQGSIVGIAYLGAICQGASSVSLSQSAASTIVGALIAAHEIGHNFSAVHDGVPGVCSTTPETYLMAPVINFSHQFSACSLNNIDTRAQTARCLVQIPPTAGGTFNPTPSNNSSGSSSGGSLTSPTTNSGGGGGGRLDFCWLAFLGSLFIWQRTRRLI